MDISELRKKMFLYRCHVGFMGSSKNEVFWVIFVKTDGENSLCGAIAD
jgi:hypothetical protein